MLAITAHLPGLIVGGRLADWLGRKKVLLFFQGMAAICFIPCAFLNNSLLIPRLLILSAFFLGAAQPASTAMTADLTNPNNRKAAFSLLYLGNNIGFAVGPLIAGFLYNNYLMWIFLGDAATTFASLILVYLFVKETLPSKEKIEESFKLENNYERAEKGNLWQVLRKRPRLLIFTFISLIYSFVYAQTTFSIPIQVIELFGDKGPKMFGVIMTTNALVVSFMTIIIISLTHRIRPVLNVALAGVLYAIGFGMIFFINGLPWLLFSTIIWSIGEILVTTNSNVYIANHTPISHRGRFNAVIPVIMGAGFALGPLISGDYIRKYGINNIWPAIFFLGIVAAALMYLLYFGEKKRKNII
jgi:MFS family permease